MDAKVEFTELLPCGHHRSLLESSVESGYTFCQLCETQSRLRDALTQERENVAAVEHMTARIAELRKERDEQRDRAEKENWRNREEESKWLATRDANIALSTRAEQLERLREAVQKHRHFSAELLVKCRSNIAYTELGRQAELASREVAAALASLTANDGEEPVTEDKLIDETWLTGVGFKWDGTIRCAHILEGPGNRTIVVRWISRKSDWDVAAFDGGRINMKKPCLMRREIHQIAEVLGVKLTDGEGGK